MKPIDKLSQVDDKLLDPTQLTFRLKGPIRKRIQSLLDKEDGDEETKEELARLVDSDKQMLSYESLSEIHKRIQRLDPTYNMYFFELLDECRALVPNERQVGYTWMNPRIILFFFSNHSVLHYVTYF